MKVDCFTCEVDREEMLNSDFVLGSYEDDELNRKRLHSNDTYPKGGNR